MRKYESSMTNEEYKKAYDNYINQQPYKIKEKISGQINEIIFGSLDDKPSCKPENFELADRLVERYEDKSYAVYKLESK